jgi:O-Antigen ligase
MRGRAVTVPDVGQPLAQPATTALLDGQSRRLHTGYRTLGWLAAVLPPVLVGYALFDRAFAYIHVPGTPVFAGEVIILLCLAGALVGTAIVGLGVKRIAVTKLVIVFALWGVVCTVPHVTQYGINAIRDAALWYYALLAIPVAALVLSDPGIVHRWVAGARRFVPWLLLFSPIAVQLNKVADSGGGPFVPGSSISVWDHRVGNIAVLATMALAFVWLVPGFSRRRRTALTGLATVVILMVATQNRGGLVAAATGLLLVWLFTRRRLRLVGVMVATLTLLALFAYASNVHLQGEQGRGISVGQLIKNIESLKGGNDANAGGNLQSNVQFRQELWSQVIELAVNNHALVTGLGFGRNIAAQLGFASDTAGSLRSPHNSHLDILARMGIIGAVLWITLWLTWYAVVLRARSRLKFLGRYFDATVIEVCIVGVSSILVNAYFDPTLESPQVAIWLWTLVGLTVGLAALSRPNPPVRSDPLVDDADGSDHSRRPLRTAP